MRLNIVAAAYALWILGIFVAFYLVKDPDDVSVMQFLLMCGAIPAVCQVFLLGVDWHGLVAPVKLWLAFLLVILVSYDVSGMDPRFAPTASGGYVVPASWQPIVFTLNTIFIMGMATVVAGCPDRRLLRSTASLYSIYAIPFVVYIILTGDRLWGRLSAGLQPIMWGLMGLTICLGAFARKPGLVALGAVCV